ncbi:sialate O-acetylesterase [Pedobacter arcticus]|uniref:sialate O-acetylesterase n=1 Tax=Pedobacter arcticus TaxID=752140 RepID=UPI000368D30F|nr:sialate O-acetylesterase [Pedobacter arcticus]
MLKKIHLKSCIILIFSLLNFAAKAQLKLPTYFSNDMILQREQVVKIWGWNAPSQEVAIKFNNKEYKTTASVDSVWRINLPLMKAGGPYDINIRSNGKEVSFVNVYFGDVWFCSGQSNMNFKVKLVQNHDKEIQDAEYPQIRQLDVSRVTALSPQLNLKSAKWSIANSNTIDDFSAVAWFFAKELYKKEGIPIGIIHSSWGGSPIETFMSVDALKDFPSAQKKIAVISPDYINGIKARNKALIAAAPPGTKNPEGFINVDNHYPTFVYNAMIAPFFSNPIKGVIWYQGENNIGLNSCYTYEEMLTNMITSWRTSWQNSNLPFLVVQLANYGKVTEKPESAGWAVVQEAQSNVSKKLDYVGLAVTNDIGDPNDIHPTNKQDVGKRLAYQARKIAYRQKNLVVQGPIVSKIRKLKDRFKLSYENVGSGLMAKDSANQLKGFAIAGQDNVFHRANASIKGNKVIVWSEDVLQPINLRYTFESSPAAINFYNKEGFPAVPFRTDKLKDASKSR